MKNTIVVINIIFTGVIKSINKYIQLIYRVFQKRVPEPSSSDAAYYSEVYLSIQKLPQKRSHLSIEFTQKRKSNHILILQQIYKYM